MGMAGPGLPGPSVREGGAGRWPGEEAPWPFRNADWQEANVMGQKGRGERGTTPASLQSTDK